MAKGRGRKIGKFTVTTEAGDYDCELRMETAESATYFSASCPTLGLSVGGRFAKPELDVDECKAELTKQVKAAIEVDWKPHYHLSFKGHVGEFSTELPRTGGVSGIPVGSLELQVWRVDLAEVPSGKVHRYALRKYASDEAEVRDGWPEVGLAGDDEHHYGRRTTPPEERAMRALVPVRDDTTAAIHKILGGFANLRGLFKEHFAPETIERTLAQLLSGPGLLAIAANSPPKK